MIHSFSSLQKKGFDLFRRVSTYKLLVCLQRLSNVTRKTTGNALICMKSHPHILTLLFCCFINSLWFVDNRFFGNRSYCYCCLEQYPLALADAEKSIQIAPDWPKGYYRRGSALMGLKVWPIGIFIGFSSCIWRESTFSCASVNLYVGLFVIEVQWSWESHGTSAKTGPRLRRSSQWPLVL